ncbi:head completion/stabilization protein [Xanthomonas sp. 60]
MNGFTANASKPAAAADVSSDAFWPVVKLEHLRDAVRLEGNVTNERLREAVIAAVIEVNGELANWQSNAMAEGNAALSDVAAPVIDGQSRLMQLYRRAVYCAVAVEITARFRSYDATAQGNQRADDLAPTIEEQRRDLRYAISDFLGTRRVTVGLI